MNKRTAPDPWQGITGPTIQETLNATGRVSPAYVNGDEPRVSNLCDIGAHAWCSGIACACSCHREPTP